MSGTDYTLTTNYGLYKPLPSADINQWGSHLNLNADTIDGALHTIQTAPVIGTGIGAPTLTLNGAAGAGKGVNWQNVGIYRWRFMTDASDNLALYAYDAGGGFLNTGVLFSQANQSATFDFQLFTNNSNATPASGITGCWFIAANTGANPANGHKFTYNSSAGNAGHDIGLTHIATFDPVFIAGQNQAGEAVWLVSQSPNDTAHSWGCNVGELNIVNRGLDAGWMRDRTGPANPTGGLLMVAESVNFTGTGHGEGKNATYGFSVSRSASNNSGGFPSKFYNCFLIEPNAAAGLTGRGIYATGDITGTASQYPYGPMQTDGTWLHGFDHTLATYVGGHAENMLVGQSLAWITGTTAAPTGTATIGASGSGANISLSLTPAGTGTINYGVMPANAANDAAAATAGVPVGGTYRNGSVLQVRVA